MGGMQRFELHLTRPEWRPLPQGSPGWVLGSPGSDAALEAALAETGQPQLTAVDQIPGHFAAITAREGVLSTNAAAHPGSRSFSAPELVLAQDPIRSFPLFYGRDAADVWHVSDSVLELRNQVPDRGVDDSAAFEFLHSGYVTGAETLHPGILQVQAGEIVTLSEHPGPEGSLYRLHRYSGANLTDDAEVDQTFSQALDASMGRLLTRLDGRQVVIPLSGGLDSRLLSIYLKDAGYDNVVNFTYGTGMTREAGISKTVAGALSQPWLFLETEPERIRNEWARPETAEFIRESYAGASLPHIQDWLAVKDLRDRELVEEDAVFLPGHTIVGNMHDEHILDVPGSMSRDRMLEVLYHHHYRLQPDTSAVPNNPRLRSKMDAHLDAIDYDGSPLSRLVAAEFWNVRERQTKYINNSMRGYEHFGFDWALPMLDTEVYRVWGDYAPEITQDRAWYRRYVNRRYASATGSEIGTFEATNVSDARRGTAKRLLSAVGLLGTAERAFSARTVSRHPMAFNWFIGEMSQPRLSFEIMRGGTPMGVFTRLFLEDRWNAHTHLFDRASEPSAGERSS